MNIEYRIIVESNSKLLFCLFVQVVVITGSYQIDERNVNIDKDTIMHIKTSPLKYPNCVQIKSSFIALRRLYGICIAWFFQGLDVKNKTGVCLLNSNYLFSAIYSTALQNIFIWEEYNLLCFTKSEGWYTVHGIPIKFILFFFRGW